MEDLYTRILLRTAGSPSFQLFIDCLCQWLRSTDRHETQIYWADLLRAFSELDREAIAYIGEIDKLSRNFYASGRTDSPASTWAKILGLSEHNPAQYYEVMAALHNGTGRIHQQGLTVVRIYSDGSVKGARSLVTAMRGAVSFYGFSNPGAYAVQFDEQQMRLVQVHNLSEPLALPTAQPYTSPLESNMSALENDGR